MSDFRIFCYESSYNLLYFSFIELISVSVCVCIYIYRQRRIQVYPLHRIRMERIVQERVALALNCRITTFPFRRQVFRKPRCPRYHLIRQPPFIPLWARLPTYHNPLFPSRVYRAVSLPADRPTPPSGPMLLAHRACLQVSIFPLPGNNFLFTHTHIYISLLFFFFLKPIFYAFSFSPLS